MASAQQPITKRRNSQDDVCSSDPAEPDNGVKKQKLDPPSEEVQPDSTEARELDTIGTSEDSDLTDVDLEDPSDGDADSDDVDGSGKLQEFSGDAVDGDDDDTTGEASESEEELPIIEGSEVELIQQAPEPALDGATDCGSYLLRGKGGRKLKLAISEIAITEIHSECLVLFDTGRLPRIYASDVEVISETEAELTIHANTVKVTASYPVKKYSAEEVATLEGEGELDQHLLAKEQDWCLVEVNGYDTLFGSKDLMPDD